MGVPEVWRYDGTTCRIDLLQGNRYVSSDSSLAFPILTVKAIANFLERGRTSTRLNLLKSLREWVRQQHRLG